MSISKYVDKTTLKEGDLIYCSVDEFGQPKALFYFARINSINGTEIFIEELWCNKNMDLSEDTGLQYYDDVEINFGKEEWNGPNCIKDKYPEYFI